jgi:hypothetical protein
MSQASNDDPSWGQGLKGYGLRYASAFGDQLIGNFMVGAILPTILHQDPRYFQSGKGGFWHRAGYALSRVAVTRSDSGRTQFNVSEIAGTAIGAGISNSYHSASERTFGGTAQTWGTLVAVDAFTYELKEFWPDIRRKFVKKK